ncbi:PQQ-binding-like beta-propeller repeat protein [Muricauda sp. MAR_2010_75]|uniref:outer membrane protein assembly factor BamB family protein n=1 Tax=Allomuricauda sp. MAR_2010_75 TaxID=1250232 RepID=UPI00055ABCFD|nr:PQQ-binding-like beta-propeller repeat protein [Muricauda sp. MAR_2010_75]
MKNMFLYLIFISVQCFSQEINYRAKWKFKTLAPIRSTAVIAGERIFFANSAGEVFGLNKNTGEMIWKFQVEGAINGPLAVDGLNLYAISRAEHAYALNISNGQMIWETKFNPTIVENIGGWKNNTAGPVVKNEMVLMPSGDGHLYALNKKNGKEIWVFDAGKRLRATPLVQHQTIYQPANNGNLYALNLKDGKERWSFMTEGAANAPEDPFKEIRRGNFDTPSIKDGILVFGSRDGKMYGVDLATHREKWRYTTGSTWAMANTVDSNTVYMGWSTNNLVSAHDLQTGKELWNHPNNGHVYTKPLIVGNSLFYGCSSGQLYEIDKNTGKDISTFQSGGDIYSAPQYDGQTIFFGSDDSYFYAVDKTIKPHFTVYQPDTFEPPFTQGVIAEFQMLDYLKSKGFDHLNSSETLIQFLRQRINDEEPSVIVFAYPVIPPEGVQAPLKTSLIRQYLEKGGKILWFGSMVNFFTVIPNRGYSRDIETGPELLGVEFISPYESGNYYAQATQIGTNMGIPLHTKATGAVVKVTGDIVPLSKDEFGNVTCWMKKYNSRPGSGFISNRSWGWNVGGTAADLQLVYDLAVYGLK